MNTHWNHHIKVTLIYSLIACLSCPNPSFATNIAVDRSRTNQKLGCINDENCLSTKLDVTENGKTPIVNISKPNTAGLSHNVFSKYNVDHNGVLINNDTTMGISNVEKHRYMKNPNFHDQTASKILFSVSGTGKSRLEGYTEIVGDAAHLMVSNPNGIYISGAGFINVPSLGLTTGEMTNENGQLFSNINSGKIEFGEYGLDLSGVDYAAILSKSYQQVGAITNANKLDVIVGANTVALENNESIIEDSDTNAVSLDAVNLGSIYANTIFIKSTDQGVGVHSEDVLLAENGSLELSSNGELMYKDLIAKNDIKVRSAHHIESRGSTYSELGEVDLFGDEIYINGESSDHIVGESIKIQSNKLNSQFVTIHADRVDLDADHIQSSEQLIIGNTINANAHSVLSLENTTVLAYDQLELQSDGELVAVESSVVADDLSFRAHSVEMTNSVAKADTQLNLSADTLKIDNSSTLVSLSADLEAHTIENEGEVMANTIEIKANERLENSGKILANTESKMDTNSELNSAEVVIDAGVIKNEGDINAESIEILASGEIVNTGQIHAIRNSNGIQDEQAPLLEVSTAIQAQKLRNDGRVVAETIDINTDSEVMNTGKIIAESELSIRADRLENLGDTPEIGNDDNGFSTVLSGNTVSIEAQSILNSHALIASSGRLELSTLSINNESDGLIYSEAELTIQAQDLTNDGASLYSLNNIDLDVETILNYNDARIESKKSVMMTGTEFENRLAATLIGLEGIELYLQQLKHTNQSILYSNNEISINSDLVSLNESTIQSLENVSLDTNQIDTIDSNIDAQNLDVQSTDTMLSGSDWVSRDSMTINSDRVDIKGSSNVNVNGSLDIVSDSLVMELSKVSAESISIDANEVLIKNGLTELDSSPRVTIRYGLVGNTIQLNTETLNVQNGMVYADSSLKIGIDDDAVNTIDISQNSNLSSGNDISLYSNEINSDSSKIVSNDSIDIQSNVLNMEFSEVVSNGVLDIDSDEIDIFGSSIHARDLSIDAKKLRSSSSRESSTMEQLLAGLSSVNADQSIYIVNDADISVDEWDNSGTFTSQHLNVQADHLSNSGDMIIGGVMTVRGKSNDTAQFIDNSQLVYSGGGLDIQSERIRSSGSVSNGSGIQSAGGLLVRANRMELRDLNTVGNIVARSLNGGSLEFTSLGSINSLGLIDIQGDEISLNNIRGNGIDIESERLRIRKGKSDGALDLITAQFDRESLDQISAVGDMTIRVKSDYNHRGLIAGLGGDNNIIIDGEFENDGTLFSAGHLNLTADQMTNHANRTISSLQNAKFSIVDTLTNYGKLITEKNLTINANELENLATNGDDDGDKWLIKIDSNNFRIDGERFGVTIERYHTPEFRGEIVSGKDMLIDLKGTGINHNSLISANRDLEFNSSVLRNIANVNQRSVFYWTGGCSGVSGMICLAGPASKVRLPEEEVNEFVFSNQGETYLNFKNLLSKYFSIDETAIPIIAVPFDDVFDANQYSKILAGRNLDMSHTFIQNSGEYYESHSNNYQIDTSYPYIQSFGLGAVLTPSLPVANDLSNGSLYRVNQTPPPIHPSSETVVSIPVVETEDYISVQSSRMLEDRQAVVVDTNEFSITLDHSQKTQELPDTRRYWYLYETVLEDVSLDGFVGSSYFLERIGTSHDEIYKLAANAMLEQDMVMTSIREAYNGGYSDTEILSTNDQMANLYDNALDQMDTVDLVLGDKLSEDQINQLESDIIWLVEHTIEGVDVLVPTVYLSKVTVENLTEMPSGAVMSGRFTKVNASELKNNGVIYGEERVSIESDNLENSGEISSEGSLEMTIKNELKNSGDIRSKFLTSIMVDSLKNEGRILSSGDVGIQTIGDIRNELNGLIRGENITGIQSMEGSLYNTATTDGAGVLAGSSVIIDTKKGIDLRNGNIGGEENLFLKSGGSLQLGNGQNIKSRSGIYTDIAKNITLHDTFKTKAGVHLKVDSKIQGKRRRGLEWALGLRKSLNIESEKEVVLESGLDLNLKNANISGASLATYSKGSTDASNASLHTVKIDPKSAAPLQLFASSLSDDNEQSLSKSEDSSVEEEPRSFLADLKKIANQLSNNHHQKKAADGDIVMRSESSIHLNNTDLVAENSFDIDAKESINVGTQRKVSTNSSGGYWRSETQTSVTHDGANFESKNGSGRLSAGTKLNITGSEITTNGDLQLVGKKGVAIKSATNTESTTTKEKIAFGYYMNSFGKTSERIANKEDKSLVNSTLKSNGSISVGSDDDIAIRGASVEAGKHLVLEGDSILISTEELKNGTKNDWSLDHTTSTLTAGKQLQMIAKNDIDVIGSQLKGSSSYIKAGGDVSFEAAMNETYKKTVKKSGGGLFRRRKKSTHIYHDQTAVSSELVSESGTTMIEAGSDIEFEGASLKSKGDFVMNAGGDIRVIAGVENDYEYRKSSATGWIRKNKNETKLNQGNSVSSKVQTDGNLIMESGADIAVVGSQLEARKDAVLKVGEDVLIAANETYYDYSQKSKSSGFLSGKKKSNTERRQDLHQTYIKVGETQYEVGEGDKAQEDQSGNFIIEAGKTVFVEGLKADIESSMEVKAEDIFMTSAKSIKETSSRDAKDRLLKDTETTQRSLSLTNHRTDLNIGKDMILDGTGDVVLESVKVTAGRNLLVDSGGEFVMTNVKDKTSSEYRHEEKGWDGFSISSTRSSLSLNNHVKEEVNQASSYQETSIGSEIIVGGALQTRSKDDTTLIASSLVSNDGFKQRSTDGNVNYLSDMELSSESRTKEKNEFIKSYTIGNAWVEAGHQAVDSVNSLSDAINEDKGSKNGKINAMAKSLNAAISAAQAAKTVKAASDSAATAATYGFKASVGQTSSSERHTQSVDQSTAKGSMVRSLNGDIQIQSNQELVIDGSLVKADIGSVDIDTDVTRLQGRQSTRSESMRYDYDELGTAVSTAGMELSTYSNQNQRKTKEFRETQEARIEAGQQVMMNGKELEIVYGFMS